VIEDTFLLGQFIHQSGQDHLARTPLHGLLYDANITPIVLMIVL
jgi:hypothetical protein